METRAHHLLIGAFTLAVAAGAMLFALWAARFQAAAEWKEYHVVFNEPVTGLSDGGAVQYNGIKVGEVRDLFLDPKDPGRVIARIRVEGDTPVKTDTQARLAITGLTGVAVIQLSGGSPDAPPLQPPPDREFAVITAEASAFQKLLASSEDLAGTAGDVLVRLRDLLAKDNLERIAATLDNLQQVSGTLAAEREDIAALISDARTATQNLGSTMARAESSFAQFDATLGRIDRELVAELPQLTRRLDASLEALESVSSSANALLEDNRGAISRFTQQGLAQIGPTLVELRALLRDMDRIAQELERNPSDFLLGREQPKEFEP